ncbi:hypothetical protein MTR_8g008920 [Medicago truncatula]|uniref:Uncharacterized protein n=1 Tax=Medicago truncatula TaxID=3880 RepID=G7LCJ9_MEDTR|nr:hypothetical protein MTR_8g008920 [Medicago truncatula]
MLDEDSYKSDSSPGKGQEWLLRQSGVGVTILLRYGPPLSELVAIVIGVHTPYGETYEGAPEPIDVCPEIFWHSFPSKSYTA